MEHFAEECGTIPWVVTDGTPLASYRDIESGGYGSTPASSEESPLKPKPKPKPPLKNLKHMITNVGLTEEETDDLKNYGITDTMSYHTQTLSTFKVFSITYKTVWVSYELWSMMLKLALVSAIVAVITLVVVWNPERLRVGKFTSISKFLNVVVGLLLGFFLSSSLTRWLQTVDGFLKLLDAVRNLQMQFTALGVPADHTLKCLRWAFSSAWLLYGELLVDTHHADNGGETESKRDIMWGKLSKKTFYLDSTGNTQLLTDREVRILRQTRDPSGMMWGWVGSLIGRLAQDGFIPPMASPTYGRVMNLAQAGHEGIREVRQNVSVQAPLTYAHLLASLVHINNLLNAATFGVVSGLAMGTALMKYDMHPYTRRDASGREATQDYQNMAVTFLYCFVGPLLYQALLLIAMHLAQPFDSKDAMIPLHRLLHQLEVDMCNARDLAQLTDFEPPAFKAPASKT